MCAYYRGLIV
ncbi:uncharacterized protein FFM5_04938 [Fusarium fujikuroi]|nr:uncharacterized protein FFM5_04938 [Fusarium fujikuroi]